MFGLCGWRYEINNGTYGSLECVCCLRKVSCQILVQENCDEALSNKLVFNPLKFHYSFCMFSSEYSQFKPTKKSA